MADERMTNSVREVPESRIKKLTSTGRISFIEWLVTVDENLLRDAVYEKIAAEFALKLREFHKVLITRDIGLIEYNATLEVIVPETPRDAL